MAEFLSRVLSRAVPLEVELNRGDKVSEVLLVKRWDAKSLSEAVGGTFLDFGLTESELEFACEIAVTLSEFDFHLIERALHRVGVDRVAEYFDATKILIENAKSSLAELERNRDSLFTTEGRRRTPGGVFWKLLKAGVASEDAKYIFKDNTKRQQTIRRKIVRDKWTENHLSIVRKAQKRSASQTAIPLDAIKQIANKLAMSEVSIIERLIVKKSVPFAMEVLRETEALLASGDASNPLLVSEKTNRRTPGGVFAQIIKYNPSISEGDKKFIFARATGGRAPSMTDLLTMSEALKDRLVVRRPEPPADDWEYQKKVGAQWLPGFIGQDSFGDAMPDIESTDDEASVLAKITKGLKLYNDMWFLHRAKNAVGIAGLVSVYREAAGIERAGGLRIAERNFRKKTPKGVFIHCLRNRFEQGLVDRVIGKDKLVGGFGDWVKHVSAPEVVVPASAGVSRLADKIIVELERLRIPESDFEILRNVVALKGEQYVQTLFEKVRKRFNRGKWQDTPGQLFGRMLKGACTNEELNEIFEASRSTQQLRQLSTGRSLVRRASNALYPRGGSPVGGSEESCARDTTIGLALIGVTASDVSTIERVITRLGERKAVELLERTREIELEGGQRTRDGLRRKTPSGVYLSLLTTEEKIPKDDLKYIFERPVSKDADERRKEDFHFAPSLFTPVNPLRVIESSGKSAEFVEKIKAQLRPALNALEYVSVLDPRLETVIRGVVLLGTDAIGLIDQCVYFFGEKRTEGWLEISHAQVADESTKNNLPAIYNDLVKAAGGLPENIRHSMGC